MTGFTFPRSSDYYGHSVHPLDVLFFLQPGSHDCIFFFLSSEWVIFAKLWPTRLTLLYLSPLFPLCSCPPSSPSWLSASRYWEASWICGVPARRRPPSRLDSITSTTAPTRGGERCLWTPWVRLRSPLTSHTHYSHTQERALAFACHLFACSVTKKYMNKWNKSIK